jgi:sulfate adenylyltransferase subunit 2
VRRLTHLATLESAAIHVIREVTAERDRPVLLFSGGKDSAVLLHLARKAFYPAPLPFPILHVDTGHNFPELIAFRDRIVREFQLRLEVASVPDAIAAGTLQELPGEGRNRLQTPVLVEALRKYDAAFGGARRDEERARAKERMVSHRDRHGQWNPRAQRPEPWTLYNTRIHQGEHLRVYPLSDWTELDIWTYIAREGIALPSVYFAHTREVFEREGFIYAVSPWLEPEPHERRFEASVRFRTVGDMTCTGGLLSEARTIRDVIAENVASAISERGVGRADDKVSSAAMEDRKVEGYF